MDCCVDTCVECGPVGRPGLVHVSTLHMARLPCLVSMTANVAIWTLQGTFECSRDVAAATSMRRLDLHPPLATNLSLDLATYVRTGCLQWLKAACGGS